MSNHERTELCKSKFVDKQWPGKQIKFEYINMSIREESDQLKMHFDRKNDARVGYQNCTVYSFNKN